MATLDDTAEWVSSISGVDNGDAATAEEFNQAPEQLAKRTAYLKAQIDSGTIAHVDTAVGAETPGRTQGLGSSSTSQYWLIDTATIVSGANFMRIYRDASRNGLLVFTFNAVWDAETARWNRDSGSHTSLKLEIGSGLAGSTQSRGVVFQIASLLVTPGGWTDTEWDGGWTLGFNASTFSTFLALAGNLGTGDTPQANSLYAQGFAKASGRFSISSGTVTVTDAFNISGIPTISPNTTLNVSFLTAMADGNYTVVFGNGASTGHHPIAPLGGRTANGMTLQFLDETGTEDDLTVSTRFFEFAVFGRQ